MFREFALEPSLLNNWKDFRYFTEKFGWSTGRLIARYPKCWKRLVYESLSGCHEIERKKIEERLAQIDDRLVKRPCASYDLDSNWLTNALEEHKRLPFCAIVAGHSATGHPDSHPDVLIGEVLDESGDGRWQVPGGVVPREAQAIARVVELLIQTGKRILLIEPNFRAEEARFSNVLADIGRILTGDGRREQICELEVHTSIERLFKPYEPRPDEEEARVYRHIVETAKNRLPNILPEGMSLRLVVWKQRQQGEKIHNRYILTERGGVGFGIGLDEAEAGGQQTDDVGRLTVEQHATRWRQYASDEPSFDRVGEPVEIRGSRRNS